ncbi:hypothetical protein [Nannocystis sp. SCPEA4]|uniref:hypothetical protein n=1 Tax=Nannocystis sp. SCPEA4 TaxID=2996787 RepID=UPI00226EEF03|nr:hypothetical protein [Nannocystis sp. SCPEA4]MCY1057611.1 hypothetical protein [Nannocystis sp. SCPEA4]
MTEPRDDLPALDPRAAALLAAYRRGRAMPPAARARVHDQLVGTCSQEHVLPLRRPHRDTRVWAVALALAAAAVLWLARRGPDLAEQTGASATMSPAHGAAAPATNGVSVGPAQPGEAVEPPAPAVFAAPPAAAPRAVEARPRPKPTRDEPTAPRDEPAPLGDLRGEQELLARGWRSLAAGDADAATRDADEHARRFPAGVLVPEQRALAAAAACAGDPDRGAELARAFLADHPRSPLARRVRESCDLMP